MGFPAAESQFRATAFSKRNAKMQFVRGRDRQAVAGNYQVMTLNSFSISSPHFSPPFSAIAPIRRTAALLYLRNAGPLHPCSRTATTLCRTLHDFHSVRALNIVSTMPAHSSVAKDMQGTAYRRLATKAGEKCGLVHWQRARASRLLEQVKIGFLAVFLLPYVRLTGCAVVAPAGGNVSRKTEILS